MATLGDRLRSVWKNYIAPTKEEVKIGRKELAVTQDEYFPEQKNDPFTKELSVKKCIKAAEQCPLFMKGARKKAKDSIRAWHRIEHLDKQKKPFSIDLLYINNFIRRNNLPKLWERLRVASFVTGDGYLLITFQNDDTTKLDEAPSEDAIPFKLDIIKSNYITAIGYKDDIWKEKFVKHYHYEDVENDKDLWIHPDRIVHMTNDQLFGDFGHSKVNLLRNIIKSSVNIDIATGDILSWFAHGVFDIKEDGLDEASEKRWLNILKKHPGALIHNEDSEIKAVKPEAIDPKPFYDYLILSIAAAFYMPTHILTGIQVGKVTGAEIGTGDYVKDLKDDQYLEYNPLLEQLYSKILKGKGRSFSNYEIIWNPIYIDELSEAEIMLKRVQAGDLAFNGSRGAGGFADLEETRRIFNQGQIELDIDKKVKVKSAQQPQKELSPGETVTKPTEKAKKAMEKYGITEGPGEPPKPLRPEPDIQKLQLDEATKLMIKKKKELAEQEKKLGEEILKEQEDAKDNN